MTNYLLPQHTAAGASVTAVCTDGICNVLLFIDLLNLYNWLLWEQTQCLSLVGAGLVALKGDSEVHNSGQDFSAAGLNRVPHQMHLHQRRQATQLINTDSCDLIGGKV